MGVLSHNQKAGRFEGRRGLGTQRLLEQVCTWRLRVQERTGVRKRDGGLKSCVLEGAVWKWERPEEEAAAGTVVAPVAAGELARLASCCGVSCVGRSLVSQPAQSAP